TRTRQTKRGGGKKDGKGKRPFTAVLPILRPLSITVNGGTLSPPFPDPLTIPLMGGARTLVFKVAVRFSSSTLTFQVALLDEDDVADINGTTNDAGTTRNYSFNLATAPKNYLLQAAIFTTGTPTDVKKEFSMAISTS